MKELEKYIVENRREFDLDEPSDGHFERFAQRQALSGNKTAGFSWKYMLQAAAVAVLFILSALWIYERITGEEDEGALITLSDIAPEYRDAEIFYTAMINNKYKEIRSFNFKNNSTEQEILLRELAEMDTIYKSLEKELNQEQGNEMVISAMIRHYQLKLEIMSRILDQLHQVQSAQTIKSEEDAHITI